MAKLKHETSAVIAHLTENHKKTVDFLEEEHKTKMSELEAELSGREEALQSIAERVTTYLSPAAAAPPAPRPDSSSLGPPSGAGSARRAAPPSAGPFRASHAAPAGGGVKFDVDPDDDKENVVPAQGGKAPLLRAARPAGAEPRAPEAGDAAAAPSASRADGAATPVKAFTTADQGAPEDLRAPDSHAHPHQEWGALPGVHPRQERQGGRHRQQDRPVPRPPDRRRRQAGGTSNPPGALELSRSSRTSRETVPVPRRRGTHTLQSPDLQHQTAMPVLRLAGMPLHPALPPSTRRPRPSPGAA